MNRKILPVYLLLVVTLMATMMYCAACAARGDARRAALTIGEVALTLDQQERNAFEAKLYGPDKHAELGVLVLRVLYGARAYERAVGAGQDPLAIRADLLKALADLEASAKGVNVVVDSVHAVRAVLGGTP